MSSREDVPGQVEKEIHDKVFQQAVIDEKFRQQLIADPISILEAAGLKIPKGTKIEIIEQRPDVRYLFLPPLNSPTLQHPKKSQIGQEK
jgi:hypothetical protein